MPAVPPPAKDRRRPRCGIAPLAAAALLAALTAGGCVPDDAEEAAALAPPVEAVPARVGTLPLEERLSGVVRAENQVAIRPEIEAPIVEVWVRSGQAVERGQPLIRLDGSALADQVRQAEAAVRLAAGSAAEARARVAELEAQVTRTRVLADSDLVSQVTLETQEAQLAAARAVAEQAAARVAQAQAELAERRNGLGKTVVRAPVAGRVGQVAAEVGMLVDPSTVLTVIGDLDDLVIEVPLTQEMLGFVREGQSVRVFGIGAEPLEATLTRISPFLAGSFTTVGEIGLHGPARGLLPGMFVAVDVLYGESERATLVPLAAVWDDPRSGERGVWTVDLTRPAAEAAGGAAAGSRDGTGARPVGGAAGPPADGLPGGDAGALPGDGLSAEAYPVGFRAVEVVAEGADAAGVAGLSPGTWVVTVGQHLLADQGAASARVRPTTWERVMELQGLQREDLLEGFLAEQQRQARLRGAEPPSNEEYLLGGEKPAPDGAAPRPGTGGGR